MPWLLLVGEISEVTRFCEGWMLRLEVVVRMSCAEMDGGMIVVRCSRRSVVVASAGRANETVRGRDRPGKVLRRTLILSRNSIVTTVGLSMLVDRPREGQSGVSIWYSAYGDSCNRQHFCACSHVESRGLQSEICQARWPFAKLYQAT